MPAIDLTRYLFQPGKRYSGVLQQQGRVTLDSDFNERRAIDDDDLRQTLIDVICAKGSPDDGFRIANPRSTNGMVDFDISPGSFYLGGLRLVVAPPAPGESYHTQADWLQLTADGLAPQFPTAADLTSGERTDLVWLEAWEQAVTAAEDGEIREAALGGPDTTARLRRMRRVAVETGTRSNCRDAFDALRSRLEAGSGGEGTATLNSRTCELQSDTRLTVTFDPTGVDEDLCTPAARSGYLGAENQAIRVQVTAPGRFIWGYDNASPLYRVQADPVPDPGGGPATLRRIRFLTPPRDEPSQPIVGDTVEVLRWGAILPNGEKVAEPTGIFLRVEASYNPETLSIDVSQPVPDAFANWFTGDGAAYLSPRDDPAEQQYFFLRVWRGGAPAGGDADHPFTPGTPAPLTGTGLSVTLTDAGRSGDHWIIAARPHTPDVVVPWDLETGVAPAGPRRFIAGLGLLHWSVNGTGVVSATVGDCRPRFRPLCHQRGCCTITVGDGRVSHGDTTSIQQAVDLLPPEGGEVCVLPGEYREHVLIEDRRSITITGCGPRSRLIPSDTSAARPTVTISGSTNVQVRRLSLLGVDGVGVLVEGSRRRERTFPRRGPELTTDIALVELRLEASQAPAIYADFVTGLQVQRCELALGALRGSSSTRPAATQPAMFVRGDEVDIGHCSVAVDPSASRIDQQLGGIQIAGGSSRVRIHDNAITRGNGVGILLGSVRYVDAPTAGGFSASGYLAAALSMHTVAWADTIPLVSDGTTVGFQDIGLSVLVSDQGCIEIDPIPVPPTDGGGTPLVPVSDGAIQDIRILDNDISSMGSSGIAVARFFDLDAQPDYISLVDATVQGNRIRRCVRLALGPVPAELVDDSAVGGIVLAHAAAVAIRENTIEDCGVNATDPLCGVYVQLAEGLIVEHNVIQRVGERLEGRQVPLDGRRGGVVVALALPGMQPTVNALTRRAGLRQDGRPAARVHSNIVAASTGRALEIIAVGPVSVTDNQLTAYRSTTVDIGTLALLSGGASTSSLNSNPVNAAAAVPLGSVASADPKDQATAFIDAMGGSVVSILNLGVSNEILLQSLGISGLGVVDLGAADRTPGDDSDDTLFANGEILFNHNQVTLDALDAGLTLTVSSVFLLTLDDLCMVGNASSCDLAIDFGITNLLAFGLSIRVTDNRFKEMILPLPDAWQSVFLTSAATLGAMNATHDNQGTSCFYALGQPVWSQLGPNRTLSRDSLLCESIEAQRQNAMAILFPE